MQTRHQDPDSGNSLGSGDVPPEVRYARATERIADAMERIERKLDGQITKESGDVSRSEDAMGEASEDGEKKSTEST